MLYRYSIVLKAWDLEARSLSEKDQLLGSIPDRTDILSVKRVLDKIRQAAAIQVFGEAATISEAGGRFISFIGSNAWFHNPGDLWPDAVDIQAVARFARAVADLTLSLASTPAG